MKQKQTIKIKSVKTNKLNKPLARLIKKTRRKKHSRLTIMGMEKCITQVLDSTSIGKYSDDIINIFFPE